MSTYDEISEISRARCDLDYAEFAAYRARSAWQIADRALIAAVESETAARAALNTTTDEMVTARAAFESAAARATAATAARFAATAARLADTRDEK